MSFISTYMVQSSIFLVSKEIIGSSQLRVLTLGSQGQGQVPRPVTPSEARPGPYACLCRQPTPVVLGSQGQ
ncbi:hypothetical protein TIFTF001_050665, partial [Ficus carica]